MGVATMNGGRSQAPAPNEGQNEAPAAAAGVVRFVRASDEHVQPGGFDVTSQLTTTARDLGVFDIPAYGFLRNIWLHVTCPVAGSGGGAAVAEDGPWNVLQNIALTEPNGAPIVQLNNGYQLYLANKYGGYLPGETCDPRAWRSFSAVNATTGNFSFALRIPIEVGPRDGLGALANQDSAGQFKLRIGLAGSGTVYTTPPATTLPSVRIRAYIECWDQPEASSQNGQNQVNPPAPGTTSFWTVQSGVSVPAGQFNLELKRKGNFLRNVILVMRDTTTPTRLDGEALWPDETRFERDAFPARYYQDDYWIDQMAVRTGLRAANEAAGGLDNGVRFHDYMHEFDGYLGRETRDLWQPTRGSSRLEFVGNFGGSGTIDVITNDVAVSENVFL